MPYRLNLRYRIFLTYPLLGLLISAIVIVFFLLSFELLERQYLSNFLLGELESFIERSEQQPDLTEQHGKHWQIYKTDQQHQNNTPILQFLSEYPPGYYDFHFEDKIHDVGVMEHNGARYYILYTDEDADSLEITLIGFMIAGAMLVIWSASAYGLWFSKKVLKPVLMLADEVRATNHKSVPLSTIHVDEYASDEVGFLAAEFGSYVDRIRHLIEREREFTANVSHELRTPLTIIQTATEALKLRADLPDDVIKRLDRIERACNEMTSRLQVMLILAREPNKNELLSEQTDVVKLVEKVVNEYEFLRPSKVTIVKQFPTQLILPVSEAMLTVVLCNIIKNAYAYTLSGSVTVKLSEHSISIIDTGKGIPLEILPDVMKRGYKGEASKGHGLGLSLVQRICDYYQWKLVIDSSEQGTVVQLNFR
jgi:signal transduction histidine kinase